MQNDSHHIAKLVVLFLGACAILLCAGVLCLAWNGREVNAALYTLCGTNLGALGSLLTQTGGRQAQRASDPPTQVVVANPPELPVPVEETKAD